MLPGETKEWLSVTFKLSNITTEAGAGHGGPHLQQSQPTTVITVVLLTRT